MFVIVGFQENRVPTRRKMERGKRKKS